MELKLESYGSSSSSFYDQTNALSRHGGHGGRRAPPGRVTKVRQVAAITAPMVAPVPHRGQVCVCVCV
jgi:hypothetical protein